MHSSPVRHSPPVRASSYCAAVRLACVRPTASVHSEPGSNSSLKTTCPKANALSCRSPTWQRIACFKTIDSLLDQNVCKMDSHPSCRRPHKIPAHTFKELRNRPQRLLPSARRFRRSEPPIIAGSSASSTPFFKAVTPKWTLLSMPPQPARRLSVEASRLLWQASLPRQPFVKKNFPVLWFRHIAVASGEANYGPIRGRCEAPVCNSCPGFFMLQSHSPFRPRRATRGRSCACPPAAGLRSPGPAPAAGLPPPLH